MSLLRAKVPQINVTTRNSRDLQHRCVSRQNRYRGMRCRRQYISGLNLEKPYSQSSKSKVSIRVEMVCAASPGTSSVVLVSPLFICSVEDNG